jgi:hypothetical protein
MTWLSTTDTAAAFRVSVATLQRLRLQPSWPKEATKREGATTYWHREAVTKFLIERVPNDKGRPRKLTAERF